MDPDRWQLAQRLFHEALDRPPGTRQAFLEEICPDPELRREVASLLASHEAAGDFIETPAIAVNPEVLFEGEALQAGDDLGPFRIERLLARGGMGIVYLALDTRLDRRVALKLVPPELAGDPQLRERLHREARALAALSHPVIASVFALEQIANRLIIVSEFVDGRTLRALMRDEALPVADVLAIGIDLAGALDAAHSHGIVHRDLKPDNVMQTAGGRLKVLDFGLVQFRTGLEQHTASRLTVSGEALGTPGYMSPEQRDGREVDERTDIYAVGVLLAELATGRPAVEASRTRAIDELSGIAPALAAIVRRCTQADPGARYPTAAALRQDMLVAQQADGAGRATAPRRLDATGWWGVHQALLLVLYSGCAGSAWWVKQLAPGAPADTLFFGTLVTIGAGWTLRLHLWFVARFDRPGFAGAIKQSARWLRAVDFALAGLLFASAALVVGRMASAAVALAGAAVALTAASVIVEPATTREAIKAGKGARTG